VPRHDSKKHCFSFQIGTRKKHKASRKKYKPCILKYKALILKYVPYIFRQKSHLIFSNLQTAVFMPRNSRFMP